MDQFQKTFPNILTTFRILIIPFLVYSFFLGGAVGTYIAAGLFFLAGVTDYFDGMLARAWKVQSKMGQFLDPIADKLLVATVLILLIHAGELRDVDMLAALTILCREIFVSGLREFLGQLNVSVPVSHLAKFKTAFQMAALFFLIIGSRAVGLPMIHSAGIVLLWASAVLTILTGYAYFKAGMRYLEG